MNTAFAAITAFMLELEQLKSVLRRSIPPGLSRYENSAEHSWQICLLALSMQEQAAQAVDMAQVLKMLLVHDIPEIDAGDVLAYDISAQAQQAERELAGAQRIFGLLPGAPGEQLLALWHEFTTGTSFEANYARAVDRLMPMLQNIHGGGRTWHENQIRIDQILTNNKPKIASVFPAAWPELEASLRHAVARGDLLPPLA